MIFNNCLGNIYFQTSRTRGTRWETTMCCSKNQGYTVGSNNLFSKNQGYTVGNNNLLQQEPGVHGGQRQFVAARTRGTWQETTICCIKNQGQTRWESNICCRIFFFTYTFFPCSLSCFFSIFNLKYCIVYYMMQVCLYSLGRFTYLCFLYLHIQFTQVCP